jgi:CheY-like chemotaxis protein
MNNTLPSGDRIRILVVEDEVIDRHVLCQLLEVSGYFSAGAANGEQALEMVRTFRPQAVLMDLRMPVLNGFDATRQLKADDATRAIPVLALTGSADPEDRRRALQAGVDAFLTKPINLDQLLLYLRRHMAGKPDDA